LLPAATTQSSADPESVGSLDFEAEPIVLWPGSTPRSDVHGPIQFECRS